MSAEHARYEALVSCGIPVVIVNGRLDALAVTSVSVDEEAAMRVAVGHLVMLGHRAIGFVTGPLRYQLSAEKREALLRAMKDLAEVDATKWVKVSSFFTVEGGRAAAERLLGTGVTAIVCANDLMALGAVRAAEALGLKVPADLSVVGYDDTPLMGFASPTLTTLRQPVRAMGEAAVRALLDEMRGMPVAHVDLRFHPELVVRGSTGLVQADAG
jgi:DNA-binding LacI/PurR family transcriptional regulator